jgi:tyramine---L-glutamate ligase
MRILVHEFASGGGLAGCRVPPSLAREGGAMLAALVADLAALGEHQIVTTNDPRFQPPAASGVEVIVMDNPARTEQMDALIASVDAVWLIAPESGGTLERMAAHVERRKKIVLGSPAAAIRSAADKAHLPHLLAACDIAHPRTTMLRRGDDPELAACTIGYPLVVKPATGAGCRGVHRVRTARGLRPAIDSAWRLCGAEPLLLQEYVAGVPASVSLLADGQHAVALAVNGQSLRGRFKLAYRGGVTPVDHPQVERATDAALCACRAFPGLRGYVGVDVVLTGSNAVVIEVNPRLTTAYLGVRAAVDDNLAALGLAACTGSLPAPPPIRRRVRFDSDGRISSTVRMLAGAHPRLRSGPAHGSAPAAPANAETP